MTRKSPELEDYKSITMSQQHVSVVAALILMLLFFVFSAGVFWGKKSILEISQMGLTTDTFADTLYTALCLDGPDLLEHDMKLSSESIYVKELELLACKEKEKSEEQAKEHASDGEGGLDRRNEEVSKEENQSEKEFFCVQVARFSTVQEANRWIQKARALGMRVGVLERISVSSAGVPHEWYQIISEPVSEQSEANTLRERLERLLKVQNSMVRVVNNEQRNMLLGKERQTV